MVRSRTCPFRLTAAALTILALAAAACGGAPEDAQIRQFFRASQLRDSQTLANFSAVTFDPQKDGVVTDFDIVSVSEERREPLRIKELTKAQDDARAAEEEFSKKKKEYQDANLDAIDRVLKAESANRTLRGADATVQAAWRKWRDETATYAKAVSEARNQLNDARPIAELSLDNPRAPVDPSTVDGEMVAKDVNIDAQVRQADGQVVPRSLVVTMERAVGKSDSKDVTGRWVITAVK
jgi:hypothetical protein